MKTADGAEDAAATRRRRWRLHREQRRARISKASDTGAWITLTGHGGDGPPPELVLCRSPCETRDPGTNKGEWQEVFLSAERPERGWV